MKKTRTEYGQSVDAFHYLCHTSDTSLVAPTMKKTRTGYGQSVDAFHYLCDYPDTSLVGLVCVCVCVGKRSYDQVIGLHVVR